MFSSKKQSGWLQLSCDDDKENRPNNLNASSYFSPSSPSSSTEISDIWWIPSKQSQENTTSAKPNTYFSVFGDSEPNSPHNSSGYESSEWKPPVSTRDKKKLFQDELNTSLDSLLSSLKDCSLDSRVDDASVNKLTFDYSPLNSFNESEIFYSYNSMSHSHGLQQASH